VENPAAYAHSRPGSGRAPPHLPAHQNYRALRGVEFRDVLWGILKPGRYFPTGKRKTQWATDISRYLHLEENKSTSFQTFRVGLASLR
jgi:hypothetical protein